MEDFSVQHWGPPSALRALRTLVRRKWVIVLTVALTTAGAIGLSSQQQPLYRSSAQVLLKYQNLASGLTGIQDVTGVNQDPVRIAATQSRVAMSPAVAQRVVNRAGVRSLTPRGFLQLASVTASSNADILSFSVTYPNAAIAANLATLHAQQYISYRQELDGAALVVARKELESRIAELRAQGLSSTALVAGLVEDDQRLRTMEALQTANASLLQAADSASRIQPRPVKDAALGIVLGVLLGIGLAYVWEALDTRIDHAPEIGERLGLPLLARIAAPTKKLRSSNRIAMIADPHGSSAEAFRVLRTNLEFVNLDHGARSIMITSALEREGKSTTVANLAVAFARAGRRVALVDLDLRRPSLGSFFGIGKAHPGVTTVAVGGVELRQALVEVFRSTDGDVSANGNGSRRGVVCVLVAGQLPPDPGEFIGTDGLARILGELGEQFDLVLLDTPPLLSVGDATALAPRVDAMIVIARLRVVKRQVLQELARALRMCATLRLGCVATGAELEESYGHGGYGYYGYESIPDSSSREAAREGSTV